MPVVPFSTSVEEDLIKAVKAQVAAEGGKLSEAIDNALRQWLPAEVRKTLQKKQRQGRPLKRSK